VIDPTYLPPHLPQPVDDGAADQLRGMVVPDVEMLASDGRRVRLDRADPAASAGSALRTVVYAYPRTGRPGEPSLTDDWDLIPGARGCTPESCAFRDHHGELLAAGACVFGLSTQSRAYQREAVERLRLPFALLSDADLRFTTALALPTFQAAGQTLLRRLTLVLRGGRVEHVFYPVFPPDRHAEEVVAWLSAR